MTFVRIWKKEFLLADLALEPLLVGYHDLNFRILIQIISNS